MSDDRSRRLRAVLRNALTWGVAWGLVGGGVVFVLSLLSPGPGVASLLERLGRSVLAGVGWGLRFGLAGGVVGTLFSAALMLGFRGRRVADLSPGRFALLGAVVGGVGVPLYLQLMNVLTGGHMIAWGLVTDDAVWASIFGATVAGGTILLARRAERLGRRRSAGQVGDGDNPARQLAEGQPEPTASSSFSRQARP